MGDLPGHAFRGNQYTEGQAVGVNHEGGRRVGRVSEVIDEYSSMVTTVNPTNLKLEKLRVGTKNITQPSAAEKKTVDEIFEIKEQKAHGALQRHGFAADREEVKRAVLKSGEATPRAHATQIDASRANAEYRKTGKIREGRLPERLARQGFKQKSERGVNVSRGDYLAKGKK